MVITVFMNPQHWFKYVEELGEKLIFQQDQLVSLPHTRLKQLKNVSKQSKKTMLDLF